MLRVTTFGSPKRPDAHAAREPFLFSNAQRAAACAHFRRSQRTFASWLFWVVVRTLPAIGACSGVIWGRCRGRRGIAASLRRWLRYGGEASRVLE